MQADDLYARMKPGTIYSTHVCKVQFPSVSDPIYLLNILHRRGLLRRVARGKYQIESNEASE